MIKNHSSPLEEMREHASEAADFLKTLSNSYRLLILCALLEGEPDVNHKLFTTKWQTSA